MTAEPLRDRLRRLGVKTGRDAFAKPPPPRQGAPLPPAPVPIHSLIPGRELATSAGVYFVAESIYPVHHRHGTRALADVLACDPNTAARITRNDSFAGINLSRLAFFDIETTGLAGGVGTLAFLIGVGAFENDHFILRQFFLRDPAEEHALLHGLLEQLQTHDALVTYNGRSFDVPIVQSRLTLARRPFNLSALPNLDLLAPARRLWRGRTENCSLGTLETAILGLQRTEADVPGWAIPQLYVDYLRTGDAREMPRVIYHNAEDILSMVTLAEHILDTFGDPLRSTRSAEDCLRLALWHDDMGQTAEAESAFRTAQSGKLLRAQRIVLCQRYAALLKRADRYAEAAPLWEQWARLAPDDPAPCIELAKYYEWHAADPALAGEWAGNAMLCLSHWPKGWKRDEAWADVQHRLERLRRKQPQGRP